METTHIKIRQMIIFILLILSNLNCSEKEKGEIYLIPNGYVGRVIVFYNQTKGANAEIENGSRVLRIPKNGVLYTKLGVIGCFQC